MFDENKMYSNGTWQVKEGQEENFKSLWKEFAEIGVNDKGALKGMLLQDHDNPKSFVSFAVWENIETIKKWQEDPVMKNYLTKFREVCDSMQIKTLKPAIIIKK
jgi:quinol monooxygenase YgiN